MAPATRSASSASSRFARIRSGSTSSCSRHSRSQAAAEPVLRRSSRSGAHSACHAPAARSCSCSIAPRRLATRPGAWRAPASAEIAATGLCLCGMAEEPPRSAPPSRTSPTSVWASRTTSPAALAAAPLASPRAAASSAMRVRVVCHGMTGSASPSSRAKRDRTSMPASPSAARVPAAPPSWAARRVRRTASRRCAASSRPTSHPAAFRPKVTGTACCSSVRPAMTVAR